MLVYEFTFGIRFAGLRAELAGLDGCCSPRFAGHAADSIRQLPRKSMARHSARRMSRQTASPTSSAAGDETDADAFVRPGPKFGRGQTNSRVAAGNPTATAPTAPS